MLKNKMTRREALKVMGATVVTAGAGLSSPAILKAADTVKLGVLCPLSGPLTFLGQTQLNCALLAIEQINSKGGIGGRKLEHVVEDNQGTTKATTEKSRKLISKDKVDAIAGMIRSLSRVAALEVAERAKKLVIYPTFYEGGECNKYLICTGQVPNQQVDPFVPWLIKNVGKSIYVMGHDYMWPRGSSKAIKAAMEKNQGAFLGEEFFSFDTTDYGPALQKVKTLNPDMVWAMFSGGFDTFMKQYKSFGIKAKLVSSVLEEGLTVPTAPLFEGCIGSAAYFMTLDNASNKSFVSSYLKRFGSDKVIFALAEALYDGIWLYAKAVEKAGSTETEKVRKAITQVEFSAPQGRVNILSTNQHMVCNSMAGSVRSDGQISVIENFGQIAPLVPDCNLS